MSETVKNILVGAFAIVVLVLFVYSLQMDVRRTVEIHRQGQQIQRLQEAEQKLCGATP